MLRFIDFDDSEIMKISVSCLHRFKENKATRRNSELNSTCAVSYLVTYSPQFTQPSPYHTPFVITVGKEC